MFHPCKKGPKKPAGLTLVELLIAISIMAVTMLALGGLSKAVQTSAEYGAGHGEATQHARVILDRISRMVAEATANERFPGVLVVADESGGHRFPDTLVVWHPQGKPVDPEGLPRRNELVVYSVDHAQPNRMIEVTIPGSGLEVPEADDTAAWRQLVTALRFGSIGEQVTLTELLRPGWVNEGTVWMQRGALRFESRLRPSAEEWASYLAEELDWDEIAWVQGIHGTKTGLRQAWVRTEMQLLPGRTGAGQEAGSQRAIPFFGSATLYYELHRKDP